MRTELSLKVVQKGENAKRNFLKLTEVYIKYIEGNFGNSVQQNYLFQQSFSAS